jgi:Domain of unknown function (DUF4212)
MQLTESHRQYWRKNLNITAILLAIWFVVTFVVAFFCPRLEFQLFWLAIQLLGRFPRLIGRLLLDHRVLRALHEQARPRTRRRRRTGGLTSWPDYHQKQAAGCSAHPATPHSKNN